MLGRFLPEPKNRPAKSFCRRKTWKSYRGMGSISAMKQGGKERYGQAETLEAEKFVPEGIEGRTLFKGSVQTEIFQPRWRTQKLYGIPRLCHHSRTSEKAKFIRITQASLQESHPHDITITREAPNYRLNGI